MIVGAVLLYLFRHPMNARYVRAAYRRPESRKMFGAHQWRLTPEGLATSTPTSVNLTLWSGIQEIAVGPEHAFFFTSPRQALVLPKRAFADHHTFEQFVEAARENIQAAI